MNVKELIQVEKGTGVQLNFDNDTDFRSDFASNVLRKNESNRVFYVSLVHKILEKACYKDKILVITRNEKIQMNLKGTLAHINILSGSSHSEAGKRTILYVFFYVHSGIKDIYVRMILMLL